MPWHATQNGLLGEEETTPSHYAKWEAACKMLEKLGTGALTAVRHSRHRVRAYKPLRVLQSQKGLCRWQKRSSQGTAICEAGFYRQTDFWMAGFCYYTKN